MTLQTDSKYRYWIALIIAIIYIYYTAGKKIGDSSFAIISGLLFLSWLAFIFVFTNHKCNKIFNKKYLLLFVVLIYHFLTGLMVTPLLKQTIYTAELFLFFSPLIIYDYFKQIKSKKIFSLLTYSIIITLSIYSFRTIFYLIDHPLAARSMISTEMDDDVTIGGGFALAYSLAIIVPCLFYILTRQKKLFSKFNKTIIIACIILFSITVFASLFFIAILLMIFGCLFSLLIRENKKVFSVFSKVLIISALFYLLIGPIIGNFLIDSVYFSNPVIQQRSYEIGYTLSGRGSSETEDLSARFNVYEESLKTFLRNPILGVGIKAGNNYNDLYAAGIGGHSDFLDYLGKFGLMGCIPLFYFLFQCYKENANSNLVNLAWLIFIISAILNPIMSFTEFLVLTLLIPLINNLQFNSETENILL